MTFPGATGFAHAAELAFWSDPHTATDAAGSAAAEHLPSAREAIMLFGERMRPFADDAEILPGMRAIGAAGHTPGHTAILLTSQGKRLLCIGDLCHDELQISHPWWSTPWDHDTAGAIASRRRLLDWAAGERLLVHAYHLPFPGLGRVSREHGGYTWTPLLA